MNTLSDNKLTNAVARKRQTGVAIITALLVVALGTITIVSVVVRQQYSLLREQNEGLIQQARSLAVSGERFGAAVLYRDVKQGLRENTDSLDDDWATTLPPIPVDNATLTGCVVDMQGHFNVNNMVNSEGAVEPVYFDQFKRLLTELNIDVIKADAVVDWLDKDVNATLPEGAEDDYYSGLTPAYRASNGPMTSVSELQLVKGFSSAVPEEYEDYQLLLPHIAALPTELGPTPVNVNTATPEVIASLSDFLKPLAADLARWDTGAYEDYPVCEDIFSLEADDGPETLAGEERDLTPYESTLDFDSEAAVESGEEVAGSIRFLSEIRKVRHE